MAADAYVPRDRGSDPLSHPNALSVKGFTFAYPAQPSPVLSDVTMDVPEGAFAVVCGSTGSGKTTLLKCMTAAVAPPGKRSGTMEVFGSDNPEPPTVGFVMQDPEAQIVCDTVLHELAFGLENLGMQPDAMRRRVAEVATVLGIGHLVDTPTADLSGGQKQLVNLGAVLAMRPRLLLLDEPTAQLDPISARQLCDALRQANAQFGITVVVATHSPELFADMASCAFELREGCMRVAPVASLRFEPSGEPPYASAVARDAEAPSGDAPIRLQDVWFSYQRDGDCVLKGLNASFRQGEVSCIVGGNGSGKTTLLKAVAGILKPQRGKVRNELGRSQAYLPQDPRLLFTADMLKDELGAGWGDRPEEEHALLEGMALGRGELSPLDLSGGQQQMLALAKLLLVRPQLLLLDEPVKGLDAESEMRVALALRHAASEGVAVIMATHDISFASRVADRIVLVFDGQVASCASSEEFFEDAAYYKPQPNAFTVAWDRTHAADAAEGLNG